MHTEKTGGRYILNNVIDPLRHAIYQKGINFIWTTSHDNWHTQIDDQTYIIHIIRDPAKQLVSAGLKDIRYAKGFFRNYNKNPQVSSFFSDETDSFPKNFSDDYLINNKSLLDERVNRINLLIDFEDLANNHLKIQNKILSDFGIDMAPVDLPIKKQFFNPESKKKYDSLSDQEILEIKEIAHFDNNLYNNANFWRF
jgi:hypothetical protein